MLGGSSAINAEAFIPPSKVGIDNWENLGNPGWNWEEMKPYYRKFHTLTKPFESVSHHLGLDYVDEKVRGTSGPIQASFTGRVEDPLANAWFKTFETLGWKLQGDPFSGQIAGGYSNPSTIDPVTKERSYSAIAYYQPASKRPNLHLMTGAHVQKIILEKKNATGAVAATGVKVTWSGKEVSLRARKEVIIAAGAFQSPKLLELSGIGSASLLGSLGIETVVDNPRVGENLQDHLMTGLSFEVKDGVKTIDDLARQDPAAVQAAMGEYMVNKTGPFSAAGVNSIAIIPLIDILKTQYADASMDFLKLLHSEAEEPELKQFIRSVNRDSDEGSAMFYTYPAQGNFEVGGGAHPKDVTKANMDGYFITIGVCLLRPFSKGTVHITSADPSQKPSIDPQYLTKEIDVEVLARHLQFLEKIVRTEPLASLLKPNGKRSAPNLDLNHVDAVEQFVRTTVISNWHPVGTCAMMPMEKGGVVNEKLIVHGTKNLRVVDSSIFPTITRGNPVSTVYAVAEKAADLIKADV